MATRAQKIKLGIFLAASGALFAGTITVFAGLAFLSEEDAYYVQFSNSVSGLEVGAPVKLRGVRVGSVTSIQLDPEDVELVRVGLELDPDTPIHKDAEAVMMMQGVTGLKFIEIRGGSSEAGKLPPGSFIPTGQSMFTRLSGSAEDLTLKADRVLNNLLHVTGPLNRERVDNMLRQGEQLAQNLDALLVELTKVAMQTHQLLGENRAHLRSTLANVDRTSKEVADLAARANAVAGRVDPAELETSASRLVATMTSFQEVLERLIRLIDQSEGDLRGTVYNLRLAAERFKQFADSLQRQPSRLFFGRSPQERDLP